MGGASKCTSAVDVESGSLLCYLATGWQMTCWSSRTAADVRHNCQDEEDLHLRSFGAKARQQ
eukprot:2089372-Amphidinium_carterae.1